MSGFEVEVTLCLEVCMLGLVILPPGPREPLLLASCSRSAPRCRSLSTLLSLFCMMKVPQLYSRVSCRAGINPKIVLEFILTQAIRQYRRRVPGSPIAPITLITRGRLFAQFSERKTDFLFSEIRCRCWR